GGTPSCDVGPDARDRPRCRGRNRTDGVRLMRPAWVPAPALQKNQSERPAGVEPAPPNWQAGVQPGTPWARDNESRGRDSNPRVHRFAAGGLTILATSTGEWTSPGGRSPRLTRTGPLREDR